VCGVVFHFGLAACSAAIVPSIDILPTLPDKRCAVETVGLAADPEGNIEIGKFIP
jgi:hypothetical protein